jgi:radical SAM superfamily enzyme YgiQ (UPF0313 family)
MRVLLIQPPSNDTLMDQIYLFEPLALEYLGAGLRQEGHEVRLLDARLEPDIEGVLSAYRPELVGLTGFTSHVNIIKRIAALVKTGIPEAFVVVGGHHATVVPSDFNAPVIDLVVIGEGVFTLKEVVSALKTGGRLEGIKGIAIPNEDGMIFSEPRPYTDLDLLPLPDRTLTENYRKKYFSEWFKPLASIRTSLGCTARCNFCALWSITGGKYLRRSPESIVVELKGIEEPNVFFCDDESMCDVKRMEQLAELIKEAGIKKKYFLYGRVDTIVRNPELFAKWAAIGLSQVFVGMEDYSDSRLNAMNKGVTVAEQEEAVMILKQLGIMMYASYMVDPAYTRDDFKRLIGHVRRLGHTYATFTVMTPLPGTELHATRRGELLSERPELYDMLHALLPTSLTLKDFYQEMIELYSKAVPLHKALPTLFRFGLHGMLLRLRMFGRFLEKIKVAHLDY